MASTPLVESHPSLDAGAEFSIGFWVWLTVQTDVQIVSRAGPGGKPLFPIQADHEPQTSTLPLAVCPRSPAE